HELEGLALDGADDDGADAGALPWIQQLGDATLGPAQGDLVDQLVGDGRRRLRLLAVEVQVLDLLGRPFKAVAAGEGVVEVAAPRPHAADVQRQHGLDHRAAGVDVVAHHDGDGGGDVEAGRVPPGQGLAVHV